MAIRQLPIAPKMASICWIHVSKGSGTVRGKGRMTYTGDNSTHDEIVKNFLFEG
jgi:hypothetical protein